MFCWFLFSGVALADYGDGNVCRASYAAGELAIPCLDYTDKDGVTTAGSFASVIPWKLVRTGYLENYTDATTECRASFAYGVLTIPCLDFSYATGSVSWGSFSASVGGAWMRKGFTQQTATPDNFVAVSGGCYMMGTDSASAGSDEKPAHQVCVDDFVINKYEVTQAEWRAIMDTEPSWFAGCDDCPVEQVSYDYVQEFLAVLNGTAPSGCAYRLPTEAEWEYACRDGGQEQTYCGGEDIDNLAWYSNNSDEQTHPVGQKTPNGLGLYDMSGNVYEWVSDWYDSGYYATSPQENPSGPESGTYRVLRGGSYANGPYVIRATFRNTHEPEIRHDHLGVRLVWGCD